MATAYDVSLWGNTIVSPHGLNLMNELLVRFLGLRRKCPKKRILIQKMDVCSAFRQIPVDPAGAPAFAYVLEDFLVADLRLQFGWRGSPGWFGVVASAIEHARRNTTRESVELSPSGIRTTAHVRKEGNEYESAGTVCSAKVGREGTGRHGDGAVLC